MKSSISPPILHKKANNSRLRFFQCFLLVLIFFCSTPTLRAASQEVIFLPFDINVPGSFAYLKNGLASVLASRLASRAGIVPVPMGQETQKMAEALQSGDFAIFNSKLRQSGAEHLILGSLTSSNGAYLITCYVFSKTTGKAPQKFSQPLTSMDLSMTAIDALAWDISGEVFGHPKPDASAGKGTGTAAFQTAHPERAYRDNAFTGTAASLEHNDRFTMLSSQRSGAISGEVMDMNAKDLDGDGTSEIVLLCQGQLLVYRITDQQFQKVAAHSLPSYLRYLSVTFGDFNHNNKQEIYLSGSNGKRPASSALEWDGHKFRLLFANVPYYLRVLETKGAEPVLLGQGSAIEALVTDEVLTMQLDKQRGVVPDKRYPLPQGQHIYSFAQGDITGDGEMETVALSLTNKLQVFNAQGKRLWVSERPYGASSNFFGTLASLSSKREDEGETSETPAYINTRILIADLDHDGQQDILVGKNDVQTVSFIPNLRYFDGSSLTALSWKKDRLIPMWETKKHPEYTVNYQVSPLGEDGILHIFSVEKQTSYPFLFWKSEAATINSLTLQLHQ